MALTDRASLLREFYRITGTSGSDRAAVVHDSGTLEGLYNFLQHGAWDAQLYLIQIGEAARWLTTSTLTSSWTDGTVGYYTALPADFLRLAGDEQQGALHYPNGRRWGKLIEFRDRLSAGVNCYWIQEENLWKSIGSGPPTDLKISYHERLATLADSTTVDFPIEHRPLIPAFAAERALYQAWFPLDDNGKATVMANLKSLKRKARSQSRRTMQPRTIRRPATVGRWWR